MKPSAQTILLAGVTVLALVPFAGKAFHIDDPLFVWTAQRIAEHPLDPYGFEVNWSLAAQPMHGIAKNPPLASYLLRIAAAVGGWSELALHLAFLIPAVLVVLGTYRLASRLSRRPWIAAVATLASPVFLVSSTNVMCDTAMLAFWVWSLALWHDGLERDEPVRLAGAAALAACAALTKYFGIALLPLLAAYGIARRGRPGTWAVYLLLPIAAMLGYQAWTAALYGRGLLLDAAAFATDWKARHARPAWEQALVGLSFTGGGVLPALALAFHVWARRGLAVGAGFAAAAALAGATFLVHPRIAELRIELGLQFGVFAAGGVALLALAAHDLRSRRDPGAWLLALWVAGTFVFAGFVNWTVNGRSVLPLAPAAGILLARALQDVDLRTPAARLRVALPLLLCGAVSLWVAGADATMAGAQREAAEVVRKRTAGRPGSVFFQGHWGFQFYMEAIGARPMDARAGEARSGDFVVLPGNNTRVAGVPDDLIAESETFEIGGGGWLTTMNRRRGAGFYASSYGPLPYSFGRGPAERYRIVRLGRR